MPAAAQSFQDLVVWQKAHRMVLKVYHYTESFPKSELYGLTSQFRRSAVSVPANIAEGFKKKGRADKARYLNIAQGSLEETRYYIILAKDLDYGDSSGLMGMVDEIGRMLGAYANTILRSSS